MGARGGVSWLWLVIGIIVVAVMLDVSPKFGGFLLVTLVFAMLAKGFDRGSVERIA